MAGVVADPGHGLVSAAHDRKVCVQTTKKSKSLVSLVLSLYFRTSDLLLLSSLRLIQFHLSCIYFGVKIKNRQKKEQVSSF